MAENIDASQLSPESVNPQPSVFMKDFDGYWMAAFRSDANKQNPGVIRIWRNGEIQPRGVDRDWNFNNPRFRALYQKSIELLHAQGVEFPPPVSRFPQIEALIETQSADETKRLEITQLKPGINVLLVGTRVDGERVAYIGKVEGVSKSEAVRRNPPSGYDTKERITVKFAQKKSRYVGIRYSGWELKYAHLTLDEEHIVAAYHEDIDDADAFKGETTGEFSLEAFSAEKPIVEILNKEVRPHARRSNPYPGWRDSGRHSITGFLGDRLEVVDFCNELKEAENK